MWIHSSSSWMYLGMMNFFLILSSLVNIAVCSCQKMNFAVQFSQVATPVWQAITSENWTAADQLPHFFWEVSTANWQVTQTELTVYSLVNSVAVPRP